MSDFSGQQSIGEREAQEDAFVIVQQSEQDPASDLLMILADGMGGHAGGEFASGTAIRVFQQHFIQAARSPRPADRLKEALGAANDAIRKAVAAEPGLRGMGCTLIGALKISDRLIWISVGDSGLFLQRGGMIRRLNADHSVRGELVELVAAGKLTRAEAAAHPRQNALRSAVTGAPLKLIDCNSIELEHGDVVLLASDGLDTLPETQVADILSNRSARDPRYASSALLDAVAAKASPSQDNTTVIVYRHHSGLSSGLYHDSKWATSGRESRLIIFLAVLVFLLLAGLVAGGLVWMKQYSGTVLIEVTPNKMLPSESPPTDEGSNNIPDTSRSVTKDSTDHGDESPGTASDPNRDTKKGDAISTEDRSSPMPHNSN